MSDRDLVVGMKRACACLVLLVGCEWFEEMRLEVPDVPPDSIVLSWSMVDRGASGDTMYMAIYGNRDMELVTKQPNGTMMRLERTLTKKQYAEIVRMMRDLDCCALRSESDEAPGPRESQPELGIHFGDLDCEVALWDSEWHRGRARECGFAVARLHGRGYLRDPPPEASPP